MRIEQRANLMRAAVGNLLRFAKHKPSCRSKKYEGAKCDCGFTAAYQLARRSISRDSTLRTRDFPGGTPDAPPQAAPHPSVREAPASPAVEVDPPRVVHPDGVPAEGEAPTDCERGTYTDDGVYCA